MKRALVMVGAGVALATALMVSLTTGVAAAAPLGPVNQANAAADVGSDLVSKANYRGGHHSGYRRGPSFGFYLGAPAYYSYSYSRCWWSHR